MKDELNEEIIEEFVGLKAKMYSLKTKKRRNEEGKGSEEEHSQEGNLPSRLRRLFI